MMLSEMEKKNTRVGGGGETVNGGHAYPAFLVVDGKEVL